MKMNAFAITLKSFVYDIANNKGYGMKLPKKGNKVYSYAERTVVVDGFWKD